MKFARVIALFVAAALVWGCSQGQSQAQVLGCYGTGGFAYPGFFGYYGSPYSLGLIPTPPYFALHPPVYYSVPVPRTYGYSPYAYPGTMPTPEVVEPEVIENPHVEQPAQESPASNVKVVRYQIIHNPYVHAEVDNQDGDAQLAESTSAR
jgi:hypothetical protein